MPNDCWNKITVRATKEDMDRFSEEEFKDVPEWAYEIYVKGVEGMQFKLWSRWHPDFDWLESLLKKYPSMWVKNIWHEEGGLAGVWVGSEEDGIKRLEWNDMCSEENAHVFRPIYTPP
jgi:hypothetical protein